MRRIHLFLTAALALSACESEKKADPPADPAQQPATTSSPAPAAAPDEPARRWYRAVLIPDDSPEIPVYLELPAPGTSGTGRVVNGTSEAEVEATWTGARDVAISFPLFNVFINATADPQGNQSGAWKVEAKAFSSDGAPFRARPVDGPAPEQRFDLESLPGQPIDLGQPTTVWRAKFTESGTVKLALRQQAPGVFDATIHFPTGNSVYLAGNGRGKEIRLSALAGLSPYLVTAKIDAGAVTLSGTWLSGPDLSWREKFTATRKDDFELTIVHKPERPGQRLSMPQLARYAGKPLIVQIGASWCDACKPAAVALKAIYQRHRAQGLEIVSLNYEFTDDSAYNRKQADDFKAAYAIPWEVVAVDGSVERAAEIIPQGIEGLEDVSGFPVALFVNRDGTVRTVRASFAGPELAGEHRRAVEDYGAQAAAIAAPATYQ